MLTSVQCNTLSLQMGWPIKHTSRDRVLARDLDAASYALLIQLHLFFAFWRVIVVVRHTFASSSNFARHCTVLWCLIRLWAVSWFQTDRFRLSVDYSLAFVFTIIFSFCSYFRHKGTRWTEHPAPLAINRVMGVIRCELIRRQLVCRATPKYMVNRRKFNLCALLRFPSTMEKGAYMRFLSLCIYYTL